MRKWKTSKMFFYIRCICLALLISISLYSVKIEKVRLSHKIHGYIEQTPVGLYLNQMAQFGIHYTQKTFKKIYTDNKKELMERLSHKVKKAIQRTHQHLELEKKDHQEGTKPNPSPVAH